MRGPHAMVPLLAQVRGLGIETADMLVHELLARPLRDPPRPQQSSPRIVQTQRKVLPIPLDNTSPIQGNLRSLLPGTRRSRAIAHLLGRISGALDIGGFGRRPLYGWDQANPSDARCSFQWSGRRVR